MPDADFVERARQITMNEFEQYIRNHQEAEQMSTTLTLAYIGHDSVLVAWCGDSRIYQIRNGEVIFQSEDHSLVNELVKRGELLKADAENFSQKNIILRAIQYKRPFSSIDTMILKDVQPGDYILICSDGLLENVDRSILKQVLRGMPENNLSDIFEKYCYGRTKDNYSMYLIELNGKAGGNSRLPSIKLKKKGFILPPTFPRRGARTPPSRSPARCTSRATSARCPSSRTRFKTPGATTTTSSTTAAATGRTSAGAGWSIWCWGRSSGRRVIINARGRQE